MPYSPEEQDKIMREICGRIASGETLNHICEPDPKNNGIRHYPHLPRKQTIIRWVYSSEKGLEHLRDRYLRALEARGAAWFEEIVDIGRNTTALTAHADRVKVDTLKWAAARANPNKFGDRQHISMDAKVKTSTGEDKAPEWMQEQLATAAKDAALYDGERAVGEAITAALRGKPDGATSH